MPIRTNRGRAAVYRRLWGWPLRSPKHLIVTIVLLAVLVTAIGIALPKVVGERNDSGSANAQRTGSGVADVSSNPAAAPLPTRLTEPLRTPTPAPPNGDALRIAMAWAGAWANHPAGMTVDQWLAGLKPYTTEEYLPRLSTVELANIPATKVTGDPIPINSYTSSVEVVIPTDGPKLDITVVSTNAGWRVSAFEPAS
jgi:hypothetical protein